MKLKYPIICRVPDPDSPPTPPPGCGGEGGDD
jgi:hypothetical protein